MPPTPPLDPLDSSDRFTPADPVDRALDAWVAADRARFDSAIAMQVLEERMGRHVPTRLPSLRTRWGSWRIAAAGAAFIAGAVVVGVISHRPLSPRVLARYSTNAGQRATIRLASGSMVQLAPGTTMTVMSDAIDLSGEAYFTVAPHSTSPFVVRTANAVVRVLGTRFTVRRYATDRGSRVAVEDGKVALQLLPGATQSKSPSTAPPSVTLTANTMAVAGDSGVTTSTGVSDYTMWTRGGMIFRKTPLAEVVREVARMYGANIRVTDTVLAKQPTTMTISVVNDPLSAVLEVLSIMQQAHVVNDDTVLTLVPGPGAKHRPALQTFPQPEKQYGR